MAKSKMCIQLQSTSSYMAYTNTDKKGRPLMALTNNERVGKALELLNAGLKPYILRKMEAVYGSRAAEEARVTLTRNEGQRRTGAEYGQWDTHAMLVLIWERW